MERIDQSHKFLEIKQILSYKIVFLEHCIIISEKLLSYESINPIEVLEIYKHTYPIVKEIYLF